MQPFCPGLCFINGKWKKVKDAEGPLVTFLSLVKVLFWEEGSEQSEAEAARVIDTKALLSGLKGSSAYQIAVRAQNSAGLGPCSRALNITTKKPREANHKSFISLFLLSLLVESLSAVRGIFKYIYSNAILDVWTHWLLDSILPSILGHREDGRYNYLCQQCRL